LGEGAPAAQPQHQNAIEENQNGAGAFLSQRQVVDPAKNGFQHS